MPNRPNRIKRNGIDYALDTTTEMELREILKLHKMWVLGKLAGKRADLEGADLEGADLEGADLGGGFKIKSSKYAVYSDKQYTTHFFGSIIKLGCKQMEFKDAVKLTDSEVLEMTNESGLKYWRRNKEIIFSIYRNLVK